MLRLALPNKGALCQPALDLLAKAGFGALDNPKETLKARCEDKRIEILFIRAQDIPTYVSSTAAFAGITGQDMVQEKGQPVREMLDLEFGACEVMLAVPEESGVSTVRELDGKRIATKLPNVARAYLEKNGVSATIIELSGATEIAPCAGMADAIIDQVDTGRTLKAQRLKPITTLLRSSARLIASSKLDQEAEQVLSELALALEGVQKARGLRYLVVNAPSDRILEEVVKVLPSMESPTVLKLAKPGEWAIQSVVGERELAQVVSKVRQAGGRDILVMGLERVLA
jgi:ATP phosphoribosyltransferase